MLSRDNDSLFCFAALLSVASRRYGAVEVDVNRAPEAVVRRHCPASGLVVVYNDE